MTLTPARIEELRLVHEGRAVLRRKGYYSGDYDKELIAAVPEFLAAAAEANRLRALLSSRASCFEHAGNCCADWCDKCRAGRQWEADADAAVGSPTTKAGA